MSALLAGVRSGKNVIWKTQNGKEGLSLGQPSAIPFELAGTNLLSRELVKIMLSF